MDIAETMVKAGATVLVVDWISGFVHWLEDSYGSPTTPFFGRRVTKPNLLHHFSPRSFLGNSWYASSELLLFASVGSLIVAWGFGQLSPMVVLAAVLGTNANQVHKWSHQSAAENGPVIAALQRIGLLQSPRHHLRHHLDEKNSHYCVLTNVLNPILDGCRFWRGLELVLAQLFGVKKRNDDAMLAAVLRAEPDFLARAGR